MKANIYIDTRGLFCPMPVIKTAEAMRPLAAGGVIEVVSDDPAIEFDLPAWCKSQGHTIEKRPAARGEFRFAVRKRV